MNQMKELIGILNEANKAYYQENREIMTNAEYDRLYDELVDLEQRTGIVLSNSPTQHVGSEVVSELPKEQHVTQMLSLDKTKDPLVLQKWLGDKEGILSWKLDGLTVVLTYNNGELQKAVTRGNGEVGEIITSNARVFQNLPLRIPFKGELILRGEAVISYKDFEEINSLLPNDEKYKNPRNLSSGSVRQLDSSVAAKRHIRWICFQVVSDLGINSTSEKFAWAAEQGFDVVPFVKVDESSILKAIQDFSDKAKTYEIPSDGLVLAYEDVSYGISLGTTAKFPRHSIAFKWKDEIVETTLRDVIWQTSRTGLINPVAVFDPVELEGTMVSRATLNNVAFIRNLQLGIGDTITVYKANMIIPTIADNLTRSGTLEIPSHCPTCNGNTKIVMTADSENLVCQNPNCDAKLINKLQHFASRNGLDIRGLSKKTIEFLVDTGWVNDFISLLHLEQHKDDWENSPGYGSSSVEKILKAIEESKKTTLRKFIYALGIPFVGDAQAKIIAEQYKTWDSFHSALAHRKDFSHLDGIGESKNRSIQEWFAVTYEMDRIDEVVKEISFDEIDTQNLLAGKNFCITGKLSTFSNRAALKFTIEQNGGKVVSAVSSNTSYLINNDPASTSSKNQAAIKLCVPIITEQQFLQLLN